MVLNMVQGKVLNGTMVFETAITHRNSGYLTVSVGTDKLWLLFMVSPRFTSITGIIAW